MAIAEDFNFNSLNISSGNLEVRLAENNLEIDAAQALRYDVFFETVQDLSEKIRWLEHLTSNEISSIKENNFNNAQSRFSWPMKAAEHEKVIMKVLKKE